MPTFIPSLQVPKLTLPPPQAKPAPTPTSTGEVLTLDALMQRQKDIADRQAGAMKAPVASLPQGLSQMAWTLVNALQNRKAERGMQEGYADISRGLGMMDQKTGELPPEALQLIMARDPELGAKFYAEAMQSRRDAASQEHWVDIPTPEGETGQWQQNTVTGEKMKRGAAGTTINMPGGEKKFDETLAAKQAEIISGFYDEGLKSRGKLATIAQLEKLMEGMPTGTTAQFSEWLKNNWGITDVVEGSDKVTAFNAIISSLTPQQRPPGSGTMSDRDIELFKASLPSILSSPDANRRVITYLRGMAEYNAQLGDLANRVFSGELTREQFYAEAQKIQNPLLEFRNNGPAGGDGGGGGGGSNPDATTSNPDATTGGGGGGTTLPYPGDMPENWPADEGWPSAGWWETATPEQQQQVLDRIKEIQGGMTKAQ